MTQEPTIAEPSETVSQAIETISPATPTQANWQLARELYLQEVPLREIASRCHLSIHAIRCRAWRNNWRDKEEAEAVETQFQPRSLEELAKEWLQNMAVSMLASSRWWINHELEPQTLKDARDLEAARQSHIASGRALLGLDNDKVAGRAAWTGSNVIDVTATMTPAAGRGE